MNNIHHTENTVGKGRYLSVVKRSYKKILQTKNEL